MEGEDRADVVNRGARIYHRSLVALTLTVFAILAAALASALRIAAMPAARRLLRETPRLALFASGLAAVAAVAIVLAAVLSPVALASLAVAVALAWVVVWWHARPGYGRRRGLPPGSLSLRDSLDAIVDRTFLQRSFERYGPVFKMAQFRRPVVCVLGLERGREVLRQHGDSLRLPALPLSNAVPKGFLRYMAPADYAVYSPLFRQAMSELDLADDRTGAAAEARAACDRLRATGTALPRPADVIEDYVVSSLLRVFFGNMLLPGDRVSIDAFSRDADHVRSVGQPTEQAVAAVGGFGDLIRSRAANPAGPSGPSLWSEILRIAPDAATDLTVTGNLFLAFEASRGSISGLLTWATLYLAEAPQWLAAVHAERGTTSSPPDLATAAVLETLRLSQSEYVYRSVEEEIGVGGFTIPSGWLMRICVAESHLLDPPFVDPLRFDPRRHLEPGVERSAFAPFGLDAHACLGARLTLELGGIFVRTLAGYVPTVMAAGPPTRGNRHWRHWGVGPEFALALRPL